MLCREADACYWIGRYVERAEATARMVDIQYHFALESGRGALPWSPLLTVTDGADDFDRRWKEQSDRNALYFFAFDEQNPDSIVRAWGSARENARTIRDQLASELYEALNIFYLHLKTWNIDRLQTESPGAFFQEVKNASHLFQGILNRTQLMGETRDFLDIGRFLERASQTTRLLDVKYHDILPAIQTQSQGQSQSQGIGDDPFGVGGPLDTHGWVATLKSVSAFEMFRKTHRDGITPANVVSFLVLNRSFPASALHGVERVESCLRRVRGLSRRTPADWAVQQLADQLRDASAEQIIAGGLHECLRSVQYDLDALSRLLTQTYLTY
jgi:uncharacterized alpha-E superfamily protein